MADEKLYRLLGLLHHQKTAGFSLFEKGISNELKNLFEMAARGSKSEFETALERAVGLPFSVRKRAIEDYLKRVPGDIISHQGIRYFNIGGNIGQSVKIHPSEILKPIPNPYAAAEKQIKLRNAIMKELSQKDEKLLGLLELLQHHKLAQELDANRPTDLAEEKAQRVAWALGKGTISTLQSLAIALALEGILKRMEGPPEPKMSKLTRIIMPIFRKETPALRAKMFAGKTFRKLKYALPYALLTGAVLGSIKGYGEQGLSQLFKRPLYRYYSRKYSGVPAPEQPNQNL